MASGAPWLIVFLLIFSAFVVLICADAGVEDVATPRPLADDGDDGAMADSANTLALEELQQLKAQLEDLESIVKARDSSIKEKEKRIFMLENELDGVQKRGSKEVEERLGIARDKVNTLELQVDRLQDNVGKLEAQLQTFKERAEASEAMIAELLNKNSQTTTTIEGQQKRIQSAEEALRLAEAILKKAEAEAKQKIEELSKATEAWLPPWFTKQLDLVQQFAITKWGEHGEPVVTIITDQAYQTSATAHELAQSHLKSIKEKWMPAVQQHWENAVVLIGPHIEMVKVKAGEGVESAKSYLSPHVHTMQKTLSPYTQLIREKARPYVDEMAVFVQPYYKATHRALQPHLEKACNVYQNLLTSIRDHHSKLETSIHNSISKHEALAALISKELTWFLASALLLLPAIGLLLVFSSAFSGKRSSKSARNSGATHSGSSHKKKRSKQVDK